MSAIEKEIEDRRLRDILLDHQRIIIREPLNKLSIYVGDLMRGEEVSELGWPFDSSHYEPLSGAIKALKETRYSDVYEKGALLQSRRTKEIHMTYKALETFDNVLHKTLKTGMNTALKAVFQEVYQAFSDTSYLFQQKMLTTCRNEESLQEFSGLLCVFDKKLKFEKSEDLDIENTHKPKEVSLEEKRVNYEVRQKGFFGWLFNIKETKYHEYEEASLEVPSLEKIFQDIEESEGMQEATHQIVKEIIKLIDDFNSQLKKILEDGVAEYERAIKGSIGEVTDRTREKNKQLKKYIENIKKLINEKDEPKPK